jgi:excisionase family DNA binding protein
VAVERLLTVSEAAAVLRLSTGAVYALIRGDVLPACRLGRALRISESVLQNYIDAGGCGWPGGWRKRA